MDGWKTSFLLKWALFKGYVSFGGVIITYTWGCEWNSRPSTSTLTTNPLPDKDKRGIHGFNQGWLFFYLWRKGPCLVYWQKLMLRFWTKVWAPKTCQIFAKDVVATDSETSRACPGAWFCTVICMRTLYGLHTKPPFFAVLVAELSLQWIYLC